MATALITGASSGIGMELAKIFALHSHDLVLVARSEEKLHLFADQLRDEYPVRITVHGVDLANMNAIHDLYKKLQTEHIQIDYLVNSAGSGTFGKFYATDWATEEQMIRLNVMGLTYLTKLLLKPMIRRNSGRILNVASTAAFQPGPMKAVYYATKAYVLSFSEAIAQELENTHVTVTALCPGPTETAFHQRANMKPRTVSGTLPDAAEVANFGYKAMMAGKRVAIHGAANAMMAFLVRLLPRKAVSKITEKISQGVPPVETA